LNNPGKKGGRGGAEKISDRSGPQKKRSILIGILNSDRRGRAWQRFGLRKNEEGKKKSWSGGTIDPRSERGWRPMRGGEIALGMGSKGDPRTTLLQGQKKGEDSTDLEKDRSGTS